MSTCQDNRKDKNAVHEAIVLEVDVIDNEQTRRQKDGDRSRVRSFLSGDGCATDISGLFSDRLFDSIALEHTAGERREALIQSRLRWLFGSKLFANSSVQGSLLEAYLYQKIGQPGTCTIRMLQRKGDSRVSILMCSDMLFRINPRP